MVYCIYITLSHDNIYTYLGFKRDFLFVCLFPVEDKVEDQLKAANPEPIIEEVVRFNFFISDSEAHNVFLILCSIWFSQDLANLAPRKPDW